MSDESMPRVPWWSAIRRQFSLAGRYRDLLRDRRRVLARIEEERRALEQLPAAQPRSGETLIVRLDDIGDYLLFRNQLPSYRAAAGERGQRVTLLGNRAWRPLFETLDAQAVDRVIWVEKGRFLESPEYRRQVCLELRASGFDTVIAPSRTRPLVLDDLCVQAAAPRRALGSVNTYPHPEWNRRSDALFDALFRPTSEALHEFFFNDEFALWACGRHFGARRPQISGRFPAPRADEYLFCFLGSSTRSRRWPLERWRGFIGQYRRRCGGAVVLAGQSAAELAMARALEGEGVESIVGQASLPALLGWIAGARAVVSNDTMASHIGVSLERPTVIVANGYNYLRFSDYARAGIEGVVTLYPPVFERHRARHGDGPYEYHQTVTADMASIREERVLEALIRLLEARASAARALTADTEPAVDAVPPALENGANLAPLAPLVEQHPLAGAD